MVGAASESIIIELRDELVSRIASLGRTVSKELEYWMIKKVLDAFKKDIDSHKSSMPSGLKDAFDAYWPAFVQQIRINRNDAGHPSSIEPVTPESVHASLLVFPELVRLAAELRAWIQSSYT